ncbi:MAG TPA: peptidase M14 [Acidobacteria bacterium]|nr:peptidase M14 [Acidobacteriota bacterium]
MNPCVLGVVLAMLSVGGVATVEAQEVSPLTRAEASGFTETTRHAEAEAFLHEVAARSPDITLTRFGYSMEGRALWLAIVGDAEGSPESVRQSGKTRVYIQGNIHAGEVEGKEAMLALLREIADGGHRNWLESMVLLVVPIYNADGNERIALTNRRFQHGPTGGMGQRPNAQGYDLNRDHMKLESPEARSLARMLADYDPHVLIDLHTTNGTHHGYHLTYAPPLHPNTPTPIVELLRERLLPSVTRAIKDSDDRDYYYYGNLPRQNASQQRGWYTFDHRPRFGNNYGGLRNRVAILSEAYAYLPFEERIVATRRFVEELLAYVHADGSEIRQIVADADAASIIGQQLAVRADFERSAERTEILLGEVATERHPFTGEPMLRRIDRQIPTRMYEYGTFAATETERVPSAYYVPPSLTGVIDRLDAHGVQTEQLGVPATREVEQFRIESSTAAEREFQQHHERTLTGMYELADATLPAGTRMVPVDQPLGRLVFTLLEPRSDDGLVTWNVLDEALDDADIYPIVRSVQ